MNRKKRPQKHTLEALYPKTVLLKKKKKKRPKGKKKPPPLSNVHYYTLTFEGIWFKSFQMDMIVQ